MNKPDLSKLSQKDRHLDLIERIQFEKDSIKSKKASQNLNRLLRKELHRLIGQEDFVDSTGAYLGGIVREKIVIPTILPKNTHPKNRILNILLSDLHFGADLKEEEVLSCYGVIEEARRLSYVCKQVANYKLEYRKNTCLYVHLAGDIIQGQLHDARDGDIMARQVTRAIHLLTHALVFLASKFPQVKVFCTPGNHGRDTKRHKERAVNQRHDSYENIIYEACKVALRDVKNVSVSVPKTPYYEFECFGRRGFVCHGDATLEIGYPGSTINIKSISNQINKINAAQYNQGKKTFEFFGVGHVHVGTEVELPDGPILMVNGCLLPPDAYSFSKGGLQNRCGQQLWESTPDYMVGDRRYIRVNEKVDADSSLDKIIKPFND